MFEGFVHPGLAAGAALAAVPLLIHLLNRQRHRPIEWAAMRFVLAAYKKTRRRSQLENLLLLLLRMAAVALLALAVARPFTGKDSVLAPLTESRREVVLLIDGSASTGYRENVETVFERELERARTLLSDLDGTRGDRVRLILAGAAPRLLSARSPEDALAVLSTVTAPTHEPLDLGATLADVAKWAEEQSAGGDAGGIEIRLLTDLQRGAFVPAPVAEAAEAEADDEEQATPTLFAALDKLHELGLTVVVEDLGPSAVDPPNLAIEGIDTFGPILGPGTTVEVGVRVASFGVGGASSARVALEIDGERQPSQSVELPGRGSAELIFPVVFSAAGHHTVTARLEGDRMTIDDARDQVLSVPPPLRVLLVNGEPADDIAEDEVGYLRAVLDPPDEASIPGSLAVAGSSPFLPTVVTDLGLASGEVDLAEFDMIVLANVAAPAQALVDQLEARVATGASLLVTCGERVETWREDWNLRFYPPDGSGLLPARLGRRREVLDRRSSYFRATEFDADHPALAFFADERWRPFLTEVPVWSFLATEPREDARPLIRLDEDAQGLLYERPYDRGRVFLWTSTIDPAWTKLPESPRTLVPLVHELLRYAGRGLRPSRNVRVGSPLIAEVEAFPRGLSVLRPDGSRRPLDGEPTEIGDGLWRLPAIASPDQVGLWSIERDGAPPVSFSVQLDASESDLMRMAPDEVEALHPGLRALGPGDADGSSAAGDDTPSRGELWRWLAFGCLAALIGESLWAAWIGSRRRIA
ncbi:MAG: BatA domain-containing protein [Planctomycetota bacterium]